MPLNPRLSVVVCTHNRARLLRRCLAGLLSQTIAPRKLEIIVVDNASRDNTRGVAQGGGRAGRIRYLFEPELGLSRARNLGWRRARAPLVAYLDDDAVPEPDWADATLRAFRRRPEAACVGGRVDPVWPGELPPWLDQRLTGVLSVIHWSPWTRELEREEWLVGANLCLRRPLLQEVGGFPESLGRKGSSLMSGEEAAVVRALKSRGHPVLYEPSMRVRHHIPAERLTARWFLRRHFCQGASLGLMEVERIPRGRAGRLLSACGAARDAFRRAGGALRRGGLRVRRPEDMRALCEAFSRAGRAWSLLRG